MLFWTKNDKNEERNVSIGTIAGILSYILS